MQGRASRSAGVAITPEDIEAAKRGDAAALGMVFRAHNAAIVRYLRSLAVSHAEDVAGQVWLDVARSLHRFNGDNEALRAWLFTIARRRMIDAFRRQRNQAEELVPSPKESDRSYSAGADEWIERLEWAEDILQQLPQAQAEVVLLRAVAGFSVDEVARLIDKSPGAVRVLAHRGLERVLELLASERPGVGGSAHSAVSSPVA